MGAQCCPSDRPIWLIGPGGWIRPRNSGTRALRGRGVRTIVNSIQRRDSDSVADAV